MVHRGFKYRSSKDCSLGEGGFKNKQFTEKEKQMILEHVRLYLISLIIREVQFKYMQRRHFSLLLLLLLSRFSHVWLCATPETAAHQAPPSLGFSRQEHWSGLPFPSPMHGSEKWKWSRSVVSDSSRPRGLQPTRLLPPWDFPGKSTGVGCHWNI